MRRPQHKRGTEAWLSTLAHRRREVTPIASEKRGSTVGIQFLKGVTEGERSLRRTPASAGEEQLVC